jgi:hypothetical protein
MRHECGHEYGKVRVYHQLFRQRDRKPGGPLQTVEYRGENFLYEETFAEAKRIH